MNKCAIHDVVEAEEGEEVYLVCFECSHVYKTEKDLEREWAERYPLQPTPGRTAEQIDFCPLCLHDF